MISQTATMEIGDEADVWEIDRELRALAKRRCAIDAEEMPLLCDVIRREVWRHLHCVTVFEYLEQVLGYGPRVARDRVRVALALDKMAVLADALANGELSYSAIRELSRIATPETQKAWREFAAGKNLRQIEDAVSTHKEGDLPTDPANHELKRHTVMLDLGPAQYARFREARRVLGDEFGASLDDDQFADALSGLAIDGTSKGAADGARHQIQTTVCESCQRGWQDGAGARVPVSATDVARAECDAQRIGSDREPERASQDVTPKTRKLVHHRDAGKCQVPGCRSARNIDIHHIVPRSQGGGHEPENLILLCGGHHVMLHEGKLAITGRAPAVTIIKLEPKQPAPGHARGRHGAQPHAGRSNYKWVVMKTEAIQALAQAGFKTKARAMVEQAAAQAPADITLEGLIRAALATSR